MKMFFFYVNALMYQL